MLQQAARSLTHGAGKLGRALIVTQLALSLTVLLAAGLLLRSFRKLCSANLGFEKESVLQVDLYPRPGGYQNLDISSYHKQLIERTSSLPGVRSLAFSDVSLSSDRSWQDTVSVMSDASGPSAGVAATAVMVSPSFFRTLGIGLLRGRDFEWSDDEHHPHVAIVSSSLARRLIPSGDALGGRIRFGFMPELQNLEVIGIASNTRLFDLHNGAAPVVYVSCLQYPQWTQEGHLFVRTRETPEALAQAVGNEIQSLGHEYPLSTKTVAQEVDQALVEERVIALLSSFFAALALLLASVGLYGLMSYAVNRRMREIGIRMTLGALPWKVLWGMLREALALALAGLGLGIPCALAASRLLARILFGLSSHDLPTLAAVSLLLLVVALFAGYLPARRAARIDPMEAVRVE